MQHNIESFQIKNLATEALHFFPQMCSYKNQNIIYEKKEEIITINTVGKT